MFGDWKIKFSQPIFTKRTTKRQRRTETCVLWVFGCLDVFGFLGKGIEGVVYEMRTQQYRTEISVDKNNTKHVIGHFDNPTQGLKI